ncbi:MAG: hypothetical protein PHY12_02895 [Eubacteriales bacterium]|nr:hypothetical protein [Eubacteriales bacterium]
MKRFLALLLCCLMVSGLALAEAPADASAEIPGYRTLTSLDGFYGVWGCCASNDDFPYLVLHADSTFEAYDWWQLSDGSSDDALIRRGTYTFNPADGTFTMEGVKDTYIAKTCPGDEDYMVGSHELYGSPDMAMLLLESQAPIEEGIYGDDSMLYMPMKLDEIMLLPSVEALCDDDCCWVESATLTTPGENEPYWSFTLDGKATLEQPGKEAENATYTYDNGLMTLNRADGTVQRLLVQHVYVPLPEDEDEELPYDETTRYSFDYEDEASVGINAILSRTLLRMHNLDTGAVMYYYKWM